ncbi:MAG: hypothetical protein ACFWTO_00420 [Hafnia paralvei]|jgi:hypothetical protein
MPAFCVLMSVFLTVAVSLSYFTFLSVTNCSGDSVAIFPSIGKTQVLKSPMMLNPERGE